MPGVNICHKTDRAGMKCVRFDLKKTSFGFDKTHKRLRANWMPTFVCIVLRYMQGLIESVML